MGLGQLFNTATMLLIALRAMFDSLHNKGGVKCTPELPAARNAVSQLLKSKATLFVVRHARRRQNCNGRHDFVDAACRLARVARPRRSEGCKNISANA
jgi:hypothetical protein